MASTLLCGKKVKAALTDGEREDLSRCEAVIERGMQNFVEVGNALLEVSDRRLYREQFSTFQEYCHAKWDMTAGRAYQLCQAAEVVKDLPPKCQQLLTTESQARELAKVPVEQRVEVLKEVKKETGKPPTARAIRAKVQREKSAPAPEPEPEHVESASLRYLKHWWQQASAEDRREFLQWTEDIE